MKRLDLKEMEKSIGTADGVTLGETCMLLIARIKKLESALGYCIGTIENSLDTMREAEGADLDDEDYDMSETAEVEAALGEIRELLEPSS